MPTTSPTTMPISTNDTLASDANMPRRNTGEISDSGMSTAVNTSGKERHCVPASPNPPPPHPDEEVAKASPPVDESGQEDARYAGACKHRQDRAQGHRGELLLSGRDSTRTDCEDEAAPCDSER